MYYNYNNNKREVEKYQFWKEKRVVISIIIWYICPIINPTHNNANHCAQRTPLAPTTWESLVPCLPPPLSLSLSLSPHPFFSCKVHLRPAPTHFVCCLLQCFCFLQFASTNTKIWNHYHHHCSQSTPSQTSKKIQPKKTQRPVKRLEAGNK